MAELNPDYYIADGALQITPNAYENDPKYISVRLAYGASIRVFYPTLLNSSGDAYPLGYAPDNVSYRTWSLIAFSTELPETGIDYYVYARLSTDNTALISFSADAPEVKKATCGKWVVEGEGTPEVVTWTPVDDDDGYWWVLIGRMTFADGRYSIGIDTGKLGTEAGNRDINPAADALDIDKETSTITMHDGWTFANLITRTLEIGSRIVNRILGGKEGDQAGDAASDDSNEHLLTSGWLQRMWKPAFLSELGGKFLSKEHDDETTYGLTMKSLVVAEDADIKGKLVAKEADIETAKAGTLTAKNRIESPDVHTAGFKTITDTEGNGARMWNDDEGDGHVITDYMAVRKAAWFRSITIEEVNHAGGEIVLSAAACNLSRVKGIGDGGYLLFDTALGKTEGEDKPNFYRCYFEKEANGKTAYNEWKIGDQALCQKFDPKVGTSENVKNQYYWRVVIGFGEEDPNNNEDENEDENENSKLYYIDLSNDEGLLDWDILVGAGASVLYETGKGCDIGCTAPAPNDAVVLKGSRSKADLYRRTCQVYSTVGDNAPSRIYYQDIHSFNLSQAKDVERLEWDAAKKHAHWRVGTEDKGFVDFSKDGLRIKASSIVMSGTGKDLGEIVGDEIEVYLLTDEEGIPTPRIDNDGTLVPNDDDTGNDDWVLAPFDWKADEYASHENAVVVTKEGLCYRWEMTDENWIWRQVTDEYLIEAFRRAETANEAFRSITEDGLIIPSEKIAIQKIHDEQVRRYMDDMETLTYLLVHRPMEKGSDEATEKYYEEVELLMTNYESDHARLASCYLAILDSSEEAIPVPEHMSEYYDSYNRTYQKVRQFIQELSTFYFRQTDEMTELGNTFFTKGGDGKWGVLNNGLVTNKDWAKLFSNYTDENGDEKEAMVAVAVKDGVSSATIEADKINLSGHTMSFKGGEIEIDTEGFKLDKFGNAEYAGIVRSSLFYNTSNPIVWEAREPTAPEEGSYVKIDDDHHQYYQLNPLTDKTNGAIVGNYILPKAEDHFGLSYMFYNLDANQRTINRKVFGFLRTQEGDGIFDGKGGWFSEFKLNELGHEYMFVRITSLKTGWLIEQATPASVLGAYTGTIINNKPTNGPFAPWASNKA